MKGTTRDHAHNVKLDVASTLATFNTMLKEIISDTDLLFWSSLISVTACFYLQIFVCGLIILMITVSVFFELRYMQGNRAVMYVFFF